MHHLGRFALMSFVLVLTSCSGTTSEQESSTPATDLSKAIDKAIADGDFGRASQLCDSLNKAFPDSLDLRRKTIGQRAQIAQGQALADIPQADLQIAVLNQRIDSLSQFFREVKLTAATGSYFLEKSLNPSQLQGHKNSLQPRVGNNDMPWMISVCTVGGIDPYQITLMSPEGAELATATDKLNAVSTSDDGIQTLVFTSGHCQNIAEILEKSTTDKGYSIRVTGRKGKCSISLSPQTVTAIVRSYQLANAKEEYGKALIAREKLERTLVTSRDQLANQPQ